MTGSRQSIRERFGLVLLICLHIVVCCVSLTCVTYLKPVYHLLFDPTQLLAAIATVSAFAVVGLFFAYAEFSVGYFVGFHFFTMVAGYLWINFFSDFSYNPQLSAISAAASTIAFLLPALFIRAPIRQIHVISP